MRGEDQVALQGRPTESEESAPAELRAPLRPAQAPAGGESAGAESAGATASAAEPPQPQKSRRRLLLPLLLVLVLAGGGWYGWNWWTEGRFLVSTDNAYVGVDMAIMAPKVSGYVEKVLVDDNQRVEAGDPLVELDPGDYRLAVAQAQDRITAQDATVARLGEQLAATQASIAHAQAELDSAQAGLQKAEADFDRYAQLAKRDFASKQQLDQARANRDQAAAAVAAAEAGLASAQADRSVLQAEQAEARAAEAQLKTQLAQARRDLDATTLRAPFAGVIGNKAVATGDYVTPGKRLLAVVPLDRIYVDANFKETELAGLEPGAKATLSVDAYPDRTFHGTVESLAPASGAVFSLLPPDNATGNFTKIVQRVPVRIRIDPESLQDGWLRPGLSVVATVDTRTGGQPRQLAQR